MAHGVPRFIRWLDELSQQDVPLVGGTNASLGEMVQRLAPEGVRVPTGFATTAAAYRLFLEHNELDAFLREALERLRRGEVELAAAGREIRERLGAGELPAEVASEVRAAYRRLCDERGGEDLPVAARSSATAEDLPEASFAGQQDSFLDVRGAEALLDAVRRCYVSLFNDRALAYREEHGFDHLAVALSVGVQELVDTDGGCAGVLFTLDPETGFPDLVVIDAAWGLGEAVVGGTVEPDSFRVFKPLLQDPAVTPIVERRRGAKAHKVVATGAGTETVETSADERAAFTLSDEEVLGLARWGCAIERHYGVPMDVEWARDGRTGELVILQARPETVHARRQAGVLRSYRLLEEGERLVAGLAIGDAIAAGPVFVIEDPAQGDRFEDGGVLVTGMTDPDWVPLMRRAAAIVTDHGGRTSHAAIVSRELGVPAVIGTGKATSRLEDGAEVTVSCAEGETGQVYAGRLEFEEEELSLEEVPPTRTRVLLNLANPEAALRWWHLPADGVGLARLEFLIGQVIQAHPLALLRPEELEPEDRERIAELTRGYPDGAEFFVDRLSRGIAKIAAAQHPRPVIVRFSDFKTNEYADLIGGRPFEPHEENPMLGFRGASRYVSDRYRAAFALECRALRRARTELGLRNVIAMVPFCRTLREADRVLETMAAHGLVRGVDGFQVYVMAEIPANVVLADEFARRFDGFSIGSNDLTQLVLGVDRDSSELASLFDERDEAVRRTIVSLIERAHRAGRPVGLCGQAPSDHPEFAAFLVEAGIDSISVDPGSFLAVKDHVAAAERRLRAARELRSRPRRASSSS